MSTVFDLKPLAYASYIGLYPVFVPFASKKMQAFFRDITKENVSTGNFLFHRP